MRNPTDISHTKCLFARSTLSSSSITLTAPSLPQPVKIPGCGKVHTYTPPNNISDGPVTNLLSIVRILMEIHSRAHTPKGAKQAMTSTPTLTQLLNYVLNGFQFGTFIGRFPSDGAANTAVNELKGNRSPDAGWPENVENAQVFPPAGFSLLLYHWVVQ